MARKHKKQSSDTAKYPLDLGLSLDSIRKPGGLEEAVSRVSRLAWKSSPMEFEQIILGLSASPDVLALLLASSSELLQATTRFLEDSIFPTAAESYRDSWQGAIALALHKFWSDIQPPGGVELEEFQFRTRGISAAHILITEDLELDPRLDVEESSYGFTRASKKRKQAQKHHTATSVSRVAQEVFKSLDETSPQNLDKRHELVKRLLDRQQESVKFFLVDVFTQPTTALHVTAAVLRIIDAPQASDLPTAQHSSTGQVRKIEEPPAAEPHFEESDPFFRISPTKARHVFEAPDGWGQWHLFLAGRAIKHLRTSHRKYQDTFHIVQKKIKELSHGFFSPSNQKHLVGGPGDIQIFEAKLTGDLRLVYRIDLQTDDQLKVDRQVILIYGLYTHAQMDQRLWSQVAQYFPRNGAEYRQRCAYRAQKLVHGANSNNITPPMEWPHEDYPISTGSPPPNLSEEDFLELHRIFTLEKIVPFTEVLLQSILADADATHQFAMSPSEKEIINHEGSCFVIGRSGTGKTTTMVFKMLGVENANRLSRHPARHSRLRQIFVTQSHVLARHVANYYTELLHTAEFQFSSTHVPTSAEEDLLDFDEDNDERGDLPAKFSDLEDKHFPLFATINQIHRMLENDLGITFSSGEAMQRRKRANLSKETPDAFDLDSLGLMEDNWTGSESISLLKRRVVSFSVFSREYWPHFDQRLTKGLDSALVFSEIMGVIRGHEDTITSDGGYLDRNSYLSLSHRTHSSLSCHRERVYSIFESYIRMKQVNGMLDSPDRTHSILRAFRARIPGKVDFIYVDEVQDLLIIDTKLLSELCSNPFGFFWGGDTAQTINVGSSFRFEDLKAFRFREEMSHPHVEAKLREPIHPSSFQLLTNYRSHGGIVDCAASLIELLSSLFPYSIDKLKKESAPVAGPRPRIFLSNAVHFEQFLNPAGGARLEFGAHQVIIVRDDPARLRLRSMLGDSGLISTLLESKGLEFDDVLLYGFFASSPASTNQWRIVNSDNPRDLDKYRILESELKRLYVAVTRARHHCWIWESESLSHPMVEYWTAHKLVKVHQPDDPIPALATKSTPEQWNHRGKDLFRRKLFLMAASCFEKAGRSLERDICKAYEHHEKAQRKPGAASRNSFTSVAEEFRRCASSASQDSLALGLHKKAGECFIEAGNLLSAAASYVSALDFNMAARLYRKAGRFDEAVALIKPTGGRPSLVDEKVGHEIIRVAQFEYIRRNNIHQMAIVFDGKVDEQLKFMERYGFQRAQISLHIALGNFREAGELHQQFGEFELAAKCFLQSKEANVRRRAIPPILERLKRVAFGVKFSEESISTLRLLDNIPEGDFDEHDKIMVKIFRAISNGDRAELKALAWDYRGDHFICLLCQNQAILCPGPSLDALELRELRREVEFESHYFRSLLSMIKSSKNLCYQPNAALLLGIRSATGPGREHLIDCFTVEKDSYLGHACEKNLALSRPSERQSAIVVLSAHQLNYVARKTVEAEIKYSLFGLHDTLRGMKVLRPCMDAFICGSCSRHGCTRDHMAITLPNYPLAMVQLLLQIIRVLDCLWSLSGLFGRWGEIHWIWIRKLFEIFQPLSHRLACATLHRDIPSGQESIRIVQKWIEDMVFRIRPHSTNEHFFLTDCILLSWMVGNLYDCGVPSYFGRARVFFRRRPDLVCETDGISIVEYLLAAIARVHPDEHRLARGIFAFRHIMDKQLQVDLLSLVSYLEQLALEIIITVMQNNKWGLDGLLLPRSWVLRLIRGPERSTCWNPPVRLLFRLIGTLMSTVISWTGEGPFLLGGKPLSAAPLPRNLLLARMCRLLVITGFKGSNRVRDHILWIIRGSLKSGEVKYRFLYAKYASARNWEDLVNALLESGNPKDHDQLLHLGELPRRYSKLMRNVRTVASRDRKDIENALFSQEYPLRSNVLAPLQAEIPSAPTIPPHNAPSADLIAGPEIVNVETDTTPSLEETNVETGEHKDDSENDDGTLVLLDSSQTMELPPRPEEENAARHIQLWYRRALRRKQSPEDPTLIKNYAACVVDSSNVLNVPFFNRRYYIAVTRGPLPHALCALDRLLAVCVELKHGFWKSLQKLRHQELERAQERADKINELIQDANDLRKKIAPGGDTFRSGHMGSLRAAVWDVITFAKQAKEQVVLKDAKALNSDIEIAFKGIIQPRMPAPTGRGEKPELNVEDL